MVLLAGLLLVSQVPTQPLAAAEHRAEPSTVFSDSEGAPRSPQTPGDPRSPGSVITGARADLKVELVSGWWVGKERHSQFKVSNVGSAPAVNARYFSQAISEDSPDTKGDPHLGKNHWKQGEFGDMSPGASHIVVVVCNPPTGYVCDRNQIDVMTDSNDSNTANNRAEDVAGVSLTT